MKQIWKFNLKYGGQIGFWEYWEAVCDYKSLITSLKELKKAGLEEEDTEIVENLIAAQIFQAWEDYDAGRTPKQAAFFNSQNPTKGKIEDLVNFVGGYSQWGDSIDSFPKFMNRIIFPQLKRVVYDSHYKKIMKWQTLLSTKSPERQVA